MAKKKKKKISADEIAEQALSGEDITKHYAGKGKMKGPDRDIQRVNVDFALPMLEELDKMASELNVSRQAVIKLLLRQSLDSHYKAVEAKNKTA